MPSITKSESFVRVRVLRHAKTPADVFEIVLAAITDIEVRVVKADKGTIELAVATYFVGSIEHRSKRDDVEKGKSACGTRNPEYEHPF